MLFKGSFIMPGMEDNVSAQTLYMNPPNPGMISLTPCICGIACLRDAHTYNSTVHSDGLIRPVSLDDPVYPYFHICLSTKTKHHVSIAYGNIMLPSKKKSLPCLSWRARCRRSPPENPYVDDMT